MYTSTVTHLTLVTRCMVCVAVFMSLTSCGSEQTSDTNSFADDPGESARAFFDEMCALVEKHPPDNDAFLDHVIAEGPDEEIALEWYRFASKSYAQVGDAIEDHFERPYPHRYRAWQYPVIESVTVSNESAEIVASRDDNISGTATMYLIRQGGRWVVDGKSLVERGDGLFAPASEEIRNEMRELTERIHTEKINQVRNGEVTWDEVVWWYK